MKKAVLFIAFCVAQILSYGQDSWNDVNEKGQGTLTVYIQEEYPFAYYENGQLQGIEVDILNHFAEWAESRKGVHIDIDFVRYQQFVRLYEDVQKTENALGAAFVTMNEKRAEKVKFTPTYLRNASVLISPVETKTLKYLDQFNQIFGDKTALVIRGTTHESKLLEIRDEYAPEMRVKYVNRPEEMLPHLTADNHYYAMVDLITFWSFVKHNNGGLKLHRAATTDQEEYGFIMPKNSDWSEPFEAFFNEGFGFTASEDYEQILNKYLGEEIVETVIK